MATMARVKTYWLVSFLVLVSSLHLKGESISGDIAITCVRPNNGLTDFTGHAHVQVSPSDHEWLFQYNDHRKKYVFHRDDLIVENPESTRSNTWYIVSSLTNDYPIDLDADERLIWFVYCGKGYLRNKDGQPAILPIGDTRQDPYVHGVRLKDVGTSDFALCPEQASFFYDSELYKKGWSQLTLEPSGSFLNGREHEVAAYMAGHTNGQLIATFKVQQWTNILNAQIPISWVFDFYWYGKPAFHWVGTLENAKVTDERVQFPELPQKFSVTDRRVRNIDLGLNSVNYNVSDGAIPDVANIKLPTSNRGYAQMPPSGVKKNQVIFTCIMVIILILPAVFYLKKRFARSN